MISVNEVEVNSENLEALLLAIRRPQTIKVVALSPITYLNLNTDQIVLKKTNAESKLKKASTTTKILAPSKSSQVVQGDRVKCIDQSDDFFYLVMILTLDNSNENNDQKVLF